MLRALFSLLLTLLVPLSHLSAEELNAGFVQGLWYGSEDVIAEKTTRIYVAFRNNTEYDLTGTVRFTDNGNRIGISSVSALPGRLVEAWVDWTPSYGTHTILATLTDVRVNTIGGTGESGRVNDTIATSTIFVDLDTDSDGVRNEIDTDDDNDTASDNDETVRGTDPLVPDSIAPPEETSIPPSPLNDTEGTPPESEDNRRSQPTSPSRVGLEQYLGDGAPHAVLETITERIHEKKEALDTYRVERNDAIKEYFTDQYEPVEETTTAPDGTATITRTYIEKEETFFESVIRGGAALVRGFYSLALWMLSNALAYPAILELIFLLFILYFFYRTARRLGRRRTN
jgi:hypothetical protein